jgi:hypothetical protein
MRTLLALIGLFTVAGKLWKYLINLILIGIILLVIFFGSK